MRTKSLPVPFFFVDELPGITGTDCRELLRFIDIKADSQSVFTWLKQLRIAPYSYDRIDNRGIKSPEYIIENLPPLKANMHFLLAFHITAFEENTFITGRFCEPINPPVNRYMKDLFLEYRIMEQGNNIRLWCKVKGYFNRNISSRGFFVIFSAINKFMTVRQLKKIKRLSERLADGNIETKKINYGDFHIRSGIHWWIFCRRQNCKGLIT